MAILLAGKGAGYGAGRRRGRYRPQSEINVTPMVDVMLVLLIIFMVAAPLMTVGVPVDLPKTQASTINQDAEPITLTVDPEGRIFLQDTEVPIDGLVQQLQAIARAQPEGQPERRIFVRGDKAISYGRVMEVMGTISAGGFSRVALLAEQPAGRRTSAPAGTPLAPAPAGARPQPAAPASPPPGARPQSAPARSQGNAPAPRG